MRKKFVELSLKVKLSNWLFWRRFFGDKSLVHCGLKRGITIPIYHSFLSKMLEGGGRRCYGFL